MEVVSVVAAVISAVATSVLGLVAYRLSRQGQRYAAQRAIGDLQGAMARFRAEFPEVMRCAATCRADPAGLPSPTNSTAGTSTTTA